MNIIFLLIGSLFQIIVSFSYADEVEVLRVGSVTEAQKKYVKPGSSWFALLQTPKGGELKKTTFLIKKTDPEDAEESIFVDPSVALLFRNIAVSEGPTYLQRSRPIYLKPGMSIESIINKKKSVITATAKSSGSGPYSEYKLHIKTPKGEFVFAGEGGTEPMSIHLVSDVNRDGMPDYFINLDMQEKSYNFNLFLSSISNEKINYKIIKALNSRFD